MELRLCAHTVFSQGFSRCVCWALGKTLGFVVVSFLRNPRPTTRILWKSGFAQILFFPRIFKMRMLGTWESTRFCSSQLSDNPRRAPRILWNSGFAQVLFFPRDFQVAYIEHLAKTLGFVVVGFLINPRPTRRILWNSGFAQVLFFPRIFKMRMLGTWKNPRFCSSQLSDKS